MAAVRLAVREAGGWPAPGVPLHVVGYSNGGALAMTYTLDALEDQSLPRPDKVILFSPMVGVTSFARFAGLAGLPAILPRFAKAAWLDIVPEYNPFKYNSFPVNAARQSYLVSSALQDRLAGRAREGRLGELPPILTFQSVMDSTVSTPRGGPRALRALAGEWQRTRALRRQPRRQGRPPDPGFRRRRRRLLPPRAPQFPQRHRHQRALPTSTTSWPGSWRPERREERVVPLPSTYPADVFSLSHIALPFPEDDALYGLRPTEAEDFGVGWIGGGPRRAGRAGGRARRAAAHLLQPVLSAAGGAHPHGHRRAAAQAIGRQPTTGVESSHSPRTV